MWWFLVIYLTCQCLNVLGKAAIISNAKYPRVETREVFQDVVGLITSMCFLFWAGYLLFTGSY